MIGAVQSPATERTTQNVASTPMLSRKSTRGRTRIQLWKHHSAIRNVASPVLLCIFLTLLPGGARAAEDRNAGEPQAATIDLSSDQILDHIRGGWTGMLIGGIEGLTHEFKYIQQPRSDLPD